MHINLKSKLIYISNKLAKKIITVKVKSIDESIDQLINSNMSLSRFGDGELVIMNGGNIGFQDSTDELKMRLASIIKFEHENFMVAIPGTLKEIDLNFTEYARSYWENNLKFARVSWIKHIKLKKEYHNALLTRFYMDYNSKVNSQIWISKLKKIWRGKDIVIIEGTQSRLGVGNDLFLDSKSVRRILAPSKNSFSKYTEILSAVETNVDKSNLILIALGPTATVLAYDLFRLGYRALDIGHIDIEYEWFLKGVKEKINISNKYVNEARNGGDVEECNDSNYMNEVLSIVD